MTTATQPDQQQNQVLTQISQMLQQATGGNGQQVTSAGGFGGPQQQGFGQQQMQPGFNGNAQGAQLQGLLVPIKLNAPDGSSIRMYLQFPASAAQNYQQMTALIDGLMQQGFPVDIYQPRQRGWGNGGGGGGGGGGGWGGNGGGYRNGGGYGRRY